MSSLSTDHCSTTIPAHEPRQAAASTEPVAIPPDQLAYLAMTAGFAFAEWPFGRIALANVLYHTFPWPKSVVQLPAHQFTWLAQQGNGRVAIIFKQMQQTHPTDDVDDALATT